MLIKLDLTKNQEKVLRNLAKELNQDINEMISKLFGEIADGIIDKQKYKLILEKASTEYYNWEEKKNKDVLERIKQGIY